jgi:hypothetical protein
MSLSISEKQEPGARSQKKESSLHDEEHAIAFLPAPGFWLL